MLLSPLEAAAKTRGNAEAMRSSRSDVIRRGRGAWSRLRLVTFPLLFILRGDIPPADAFLAFQDSPLLILGASPASAGWRAAEWEELARRPWKRSNVHLQKRKRKKRQEELESNEVCSPVSTLSAPREIKRSEIRRRRSRRRGEEEREQTGAGSRQGTTTNAATSSRSWQLADPDHVLIVSRWLLTGVDVAGAQTVAPYQKCFGPQEKGMKQ